MGGFKFNVQLPSDALGSDLLEEIVKKCELHGSQIHKHGNVIALTFRQVQKAEQVNVGKKVFKGGEDLSPEEYLIWHGIGVLENMLILPDKVGLPAGLQSLTFVLVLADACINLSHAAFLQDFQHTGTQHDAGY